MRSGHLAALALLLAASPAAAGGAEELLGWLPTDTVSVTGAPGARAPLLSWLNSSFQVVEKKPPACWVKLTAAIEGSFQVWTASPRPSEALLVRGTIDRAAAERCMTESFRLLEAPTKLTRRETLTRMESQRAGEAWLGWSRGWIVWSPDRARVEQLLAALGAKNSEPTPLAKALRRVNLGAELWMASTVDFTQRMLGVPSRSMVGWLAKDASGLSMPVALEFGSEAEAERAAAALAKLGSDGSLSIPLREAIGRIKSRRQRHFVTVELDPAVWMKPEIMGALQERLQLK
jgi:hypothetical protein